MIFTIKCIGNDFYDKNELKMILLQKFMGNYSYYKSTLEIIFIIKMHWK